MSIVKLIDFPEIRQAFGYDCGIACLLAVLRYYGFEKYEAELVNVLNVNPKIGVDIKKIVKVAKAFKLSTEYTTKLNIPDLKKLLDDNIPIILLIEAWTHKDDPVDWENNYDDGHYVVLIGYDDKGNLIFEDPFLFERGFMTEKELEERWRGLDDNNQKEEHTAIVIKGIPKFTSKKAIHIENKLKLSTIVQDVLNKIS